MKARSIRVSTKLFSGYALVVVLIITLGITSLFQYETLEGFTIQIHDHPLAVSNAVRDIKIDIFKIQYNLELLSTDLSTIQFNEIYRDTKDLQQNISKNFDLIHERFLGDMAQVDEALSVYNEYLPTLNQILEFFEYDNIEKALELIDLNGRDIVIELSNKVDRMENFAYGKGEEFYNNAIESSRDIFIFTIIFIIIIVIVSMVLGGVLSLNITRPIEKLLTYVKKLSVGDQDFIIEVTGDDEINRLAKSLELMQTNLLEVTNTAKQIANGNYSGELSPRSVKDDLVESINKMNKSLRDLKYDNDYRDWVKSGINLLNEEMRGDKNLIDLSTNILNTICNYVEAKVGTLYIYDPEEKSLKMFSSYAYNNRKKLNNKFYLGEGVIGQAALEKKIISLSNIPDNYIEISSGLGESTPRNIIAIPFSFNNNLKGVVELGSFDAYGDREKEFFNNLDEIIGVSVNSCQTRESMKIVMQQQQQQANELVAQQEELRSTNEELEEKTERLTKSEMRLQQQQEELKTTNEELEEKTEFLEKQRDEINKKNAELEIVRDDIIKKAKDLEVSSKYKSEFLANMSHELRTPLNSLLILSQDLLTNRGDRLNDDDLKSAEIIYNSGNDLLKLINEILDLAKIESGKTELDINEISIVSIEEVIINNFYALAKDKGVDLQVKVDDSSPSKINSDSQKVNQIIKNLISNAIKFTNKGVVKVNFSKPVNRDYQLLIEVVDTGIGISKDKHHIVFDAFKQADGSTSREFGGTGLGLSISRELTSLLGGELLLESEPEIGSTFSLYLPSFKDNIIDTYDGEIKVPVDDSVKVEVLDDRDNIKEEDSLIIIIEDDRDFAYVLKRSCNENNFKALISLSGEDGLLLIEEYNPDAIILDVKLPGMNGLHVLDHLKKNKKTRHLPVHIISGDDRESEVYDKGVLGFLQKPIDKKALDLLFDKIRNVINKTVKDLLIVEDDENLRYSIEKLIGDEDVQRTCAHTGQEALTYLKDNNFDCMILDLNLPDISGYEILKSLDKMNLKYKPPVIIYTGKEISLEEEFELRKYSSSIIIKGVHSQERLLDETSLFLHRVIENLPLQKQNMISKIYDTDSVFKDKNILIVDDDMRNIFAVSKIIEERGMVVHKAINGQKALNFLAINSNIDLILMDIMMPEMDGYEAMEEIRKQPEFNNLPIIALTAKAMKEDRNRCIKAGANDYMSKPIDTDRLLSLMRVWLYK